MIGIAAVGVIASAVTYERRPPAMSTISQTKGVLGVEGHSDTELILVAPR